MTNNVRFNQTLNSCQHPQAVYTVLAALAAQEARATFPERFSGKTDQEVINEIADVVRRSGRAQV